MNQMTDNAVEDMSLTSVMIAEPHALVRQALVALVREARPAWACDGVAGLADLRARLSVYAPSLVLLDPRLTGQEGLADLCGAFRDTKFVVLSHQDDRAAILACLAAGVQGYILTSSGTEQFIRALETILTGGLFAPASLSGSPIHPPATQSLPEPAPLPVLAHLTDRQRDVFALLAEGCATKTIARRLDLAVGTVKVHLAAIYRTLGASSRLEALAKAHRAHVAA